jgi:hypothetical protein
MADKKDFLFEVLTPLGFKVGVTKSYWEVIIKIKHPVMAGREQLWNNQTKFVRANLIPMFICFIKQSEKNAGFVQFPSAQMSWKAFWLQRTQPTQLRKECKYGTSKSLL